MSTGESSRVFLDNAGRAPWHPAARQAFEAALADGWADPRRLHAEGRRAAALLDGARESLATSLGTNTPNIHLAPSHVAALHTAISAIRGARRRTGRSAGNSAAGGPSVGAAGAGVVPGNTGAVVCSAVERAAVLNAADLGSRITIGVDTLGRVDAAAMSQAVAADGVGLAALQLANGEVGTRQPVEEVHEAATSAGVPLLVDAGCGVGHIPIPRTWDVLSADPGDWGGPAGVGVLAVRTQVRWRRTWPQDPEPWFPGGVSIPAAFGAAVGLEAVLADMAHEDARRRALIDRVRTQVAQIPDTEVVGDPVQRLPHVATFSFLYADGEALLSELDRAGIAVGSGSACTAASLEPSHVLAAMGVLTHGNVRIAIDRSTTDADIDRFLDVLPGAVARVRSALGVDGL